jgi:hypothetical protein
VTPDNPYSNKGTIFDVLRPKISEGWLLSRKFNRLGKVPVK